LVTKKKRATAITLRKEGYSYRQIAAKVGQGVPLAGLLKVCKCLGKTGMIKNKAGRDRKQVTRKEASNNSSN